MIKTTSTKVSPSQHRIRIALATEEDRASIYHLRHLVYAQELRQHVENPKGRLNDPLDAYNLYIVASLGDQILGFISVTPPGRSYSIDKYLAREDLPFACDDALYEVRLLTVVPGYRHSFRGAKVANLLIYAALRWVEAHGGQRIVAMGRREAMDFYRKAGLQPLGRQIKSGAVSFELMSVTLAELRKRRSRYTALLHYLNRQVDWRLTVPYHSPMACNHGGAFFESIGPEFDRLERSRAIINADVLDAWFPPAPPVVSAFRDHLAWLLATSPPVDGGGLVRTIARVRGISPYCVLVGAGSSNLIFLSFRHWLTPASRVLIPDPTYGEYAHVCEEIIGCQVDRFPLTRETSYRLDLATLEACVAGGKYDLVVLVNPNNPTGQHIRREELETTLRRFPARTRVWVDEAYVEYVGADQSLERFSVCTPNVFVCKSLSKGYALSGVRVAYLCAAPLLLEEMRKLTPPWAVGLPAQVAGVRALQAPDYYAARYRETQELRHQQTEGLLEMNRRLQVLPGTANFVLCHLPEDGPDAATVVNRCCKHGLYLRDVSNMGTQLGEHALRIAVKDETTQRRILEILARAL